MTGAKTLSSNSLDRGNIRSFGIQPFLPVLIESRSGDAWLTQTSDASEFDLVGLPTGFYRVRALDVFGRVSFARGCYVGPGQSAKLANRNWTKLDLDEPDAREIMGVVRWESGLPVAKAVVFVQHTNNFRRFLRRVETDESGFYSIPGVPGDEPYFIFALPPNEDNAIKNFRYFDVISAQREVWHDLILHPHRVKGKLALSNPKPSIELVRIGPDIERKVWTFQADWSGDLGISNIPHGRYRVQTIPRGGEPSYRSAPFDITDGQAEILLNWPEPLL